MDIDIGFTSIIILVIILVIWFLIGKRMNYKKEKEIWSVLSSLIKKYFDVKKVDYRGFGSSGYQLLVSSPGKYFDKYEITVIMMDRENLIHYIYQKVKGVRDLIIIKADFKGGFPYHLDISHLKRRRIKGTLYGDYPIIYKGDSRGDQRISNAVDRLSGYLNDFISLSLSKDSPNMILTVYYNPESIKDVIKSTLELSKIR